jgi:hypothetical protein
MNAICSFVYDHANDVICTDIYITIYISDIGSVDKLENVGTKGPHSNLCENAQTHLKDYDDDDKYALSKFWHVG